MSKTYVQGNIPKRIEKAYKYLYDQIKVSLPNETKRMNKGSEFCLIVAGAHKVGSTWVYKMIKDLNVFREWPVPITYRSNRKNHGLIGLHKKGVEEYFNNTRGFKLYKSHSEPPAWAPGDKVRFITVIRDPRDVVISNIFYLQNLAPELGGWSDLISLPLKARIGKYLEKAVYDLELLENWSEYGPAKTLYYEKLLQSPQLSMKQVFEQIGLNVSDAECERIVNNNAFAKLSGGRKTGQENTRSFFRKGVAGDWKNHFGKEEIELYKTVNNGRWNQLLVHLGYEESDNW